MVRRSMRASARRWSPAWAGPGGDTCPCMHRSRGPTATTNSPDASGDHLANGFKVDFSGVPHDCRGSRRQPNGAPSRLLHVPSPRLHATTPARLLLCAATLLVLGACSSQGVDHASDTPARPSTPASTPTTNSPHTTQDPASTPPQLISYAGGESAGVEVLTTADANNLAGAPDSFKKFIGRTAERLTSGASCEGGYVGVTVKTLRTDGYAVGAVNECGGYVALWAIVAGDWKEIDATQDLWDCAALAQHRVPSDIAGDTCYDRDAQAQHSYQQA